MKQSYAHDHLKCDHSSLQFKTSAASFSSLCVAIVCRLADIQQQGPEVQMLRDRTRQRKRGDALLQGSLLPRLLLLRLLSKLQRVGHPPELLRSLSLRSLILIVDPVQSA